MLGLGSLLLNLLFCHSKLSYGLRIALPLRPNGLQVIVKGGPACPDNPGAAPE